MADRGGAALKRGRFRARRDVPARASAVSAGQPDGALSLADTGPGDRPSSGAPAAAWVTAEERLREFRVRHALKIALACCLCVLVPALLQIQSIYMCPLFAFMLLTGFYADSLAAALDALALVLVAAAGAVLITALFVEAPPIHLALMLAWLFAITLLLDRFPLGALMGGIIVAMLLFTSIFVAETTRVASSLHFFGLLLIAMAIAVAVDHLLWPPRRRAVFLDVLATIYESLGAGFTGLRARGADDPSELRALLRLHELARVVQSYHGSGLNQGNPLVQLLTHSSALLLHLEFQRREWRRAGPPVAAATLSEADRLLAGIGAQCRRIGAAAVNRTPAPPVEPWLAESAALLVELAPEPRPAPDAERPGRVRSWSTPPGLPMLARAVIRLGEATFSYNQAAALLASPRIAFTAARPPLRIGAPELKRSARTVLIVVLLILGQDWLDLPGQTLVAFYAVAFGAAANLGQAYSRTVAGLAGILTGLLYAILCIAIVAALPSFPLFLGLLFLGIFCAGYLALRPGPVGVGALQAGLVLPFATLTYDGPEWTLANAESRALALLVAGGMALLVHRLVWPALPLRGLRRSIAATLADAGSKLAAVFAEPSPADLTAAAPRLLPLSAVVPRVLSLSNDAKYLFSGLGDDSRRYHSVIQGLMSLHVHLSLLGGMIGRLDPPLLQGFRGALAPVVGRVAEACAAVSAQFAPVPAGAPSARLDTGAAGAAVEPIEGSLRALGPPAQDQRVVVSLLAQSLDHVADCLVEISALAGEINRPRAPAPARGGP
jgi:uncharacterized membrane protein YccC